MKWWQTPGMKDFLDEYIPGHSQAEVAEAASGIFHTEVTPLMIRYYKKSHRIKSGTRRQYGTLFPKEIAEYILANYKGVGPAGMGKQLKAIFGREYVGRQIETFYRLHHLNSGLTGRFEKGNIPANKGKKMQNVPDSVKANYFKKGHVPVNKEPIGTLKKRYRWLWRKVAENEWIPEHRRVWVEAYGPIPEGCSIYFLDGNCYNPDLSNLVLVDGQDRMEIIKRSGSVSDPQLHTSAVLLGKVAAAAKRAKWRIKNED